MKRSTKSPRVLIVEDDPLIAMEITDILEQDGCNVVGSAGSVASALDTARREKVDLALIDVSVGAETTEPVATVLSRQAIPFGIVTAYPPCVLPSGMRGRPIVQKPFVAREIRQLARNLSASVGANS
jgi:DNA-binding response OmpR family regulator